jgi:hypothetical protein
MLRDIQESGAPGAIAREGRAGMSLRSLSLIIVLGGLAFIVAHASDKLGFIAVASVGSMVAGASMLIGGLLGFLFGIPRTLQQDGPMSPGMRGMQEMGEPGVAYSVNTNLEQISDWLTKILVGVGLTQIEKIPAELENIAMHIGRAMGDEGRSHAFALSVMLYFLVCGFLLGYLWTRLYLAGEFRKADRTLIGDLTIQLERASTQVGQMERKLEAIEQQSDLDAAALSLTYRQLNPNPDGPPVSQEELHRAIGMATPSVKVHLFNQAQKMRNENWQSPETKEIMERTIPVFRALAGCDTENRFHRNHGQLGFALKDQRRPDWRGAEAELTRAIAIRGSWEEHGWLFYEFNRAVCRIMLDEDYRNGRPSTASRRRMILEDLRAAAGSELRGLILDPHPSDPVIRNWLTLNDVTEKELNE